MRFIIAILLWGFLCLSWADSHAQVYRYGDIVISEVMPRPNPNLSQMPDSEYAELHNRTERPISLAGFTYADQTRVITLPDVTIPAGGYAILVPRTRRDRWAAFTDIIIIDLSPWPTLLVGGDDLTLRGPSGELVYFLAYRDTWYRNTIKAQGGHSLEMIDRDAICLEASNWRASDDPRGGTPGQPNSVQGQVVDTIAPRLLRVAVLEERKIRLQFDKRMDLASAFQATYTISPNIALEEIQLEEPANRSIVLHLAQALQANVYYQVKIANLRDCAGNALDGDAQTAFFGLPSEVEVGDVVINELLPNPRTGGVKFVELYNASSKVLNLQNWRLANLNSAGEPANFRTISSQVLLLGPQDYIVFTDDAAILAREYPQGNPSKFITLSLPSYPQSSGNVLLINQGTTILDQFAYNERFHHPLTREPRGISLERISPSGLTNDVNNWSSAAQSAGFATPGRTNSQARRFESLAQNFQIEPRAFAPDDHAGATFCTIAYQFEQPGRMATIRIFDVGGRVVRTLAQNEGLGTEGFFIWDGTTDQGNKARIGYYILVAEVYDLEGRFHTFKETLVIATRF